jgi:hypothetical protein
LDYYEAMETYSRIGLLRSYGNLQSYWTTTKLWYWTTTKLWILTVVLDYYEAKETYSRIALLGSNSERATFPKGEIRTISNTLGRMKFFLGGIRVRQYTPNEWRSCKTTLQTS